MPKNNEATPSDTTIIVPRETPAANAAVNHSSRVKRHNRRAFEQTREQPVMGQTSNSAGQGSKDGSIRDGQPLRIEFQTSDPNIRIIWFAPAQTNSRESKAETD